MKKTIAKELISISKEAAISMPKVSKEAVRIAKMVLADSVNDEYIYDPEHKQKPGGGYRKTEKGWTKTEEGKSEQTNPGEKPKTENAPGNQDQTPKPLSKKEEYSKVQEIASNPNTDPKLLSKLAESDDDDTLIKLAQNPASNEEVLLKVLDTYQRGGYGADTHGNRDYIILEMNERDDLTEPVMDKIEEIQGIHQDIQDGIRGLDGEMLEEDDGGEIVDTENSTQEEKDMTWMVNQDKYQDKVKELAKTSKYGGFLEAASEAQNPAIREMVAFNKNTPTEIVVKLSKDKDPNVRYRIAQREGLPPEVMEKLSKDRDAAIRTAIADNNEVSLDILERLVNDRDKKVRQIADENIDDKREEFVNTPHPTKENSNLETFKNKVDALDLEDGDYVRNTVSSFSKEELDDLVDWGNQDMYVSPDVRWGLAKNPNRDGYDLSESLGDDDPNVMMAIVQNPNIPEETLDWIVNEDTDMLDQLSDYSGTGLYTIEEHPEIMEEAKRHLEAMKSKKPFKQKYPDMMFKTHHGN